jgi:GNAT superfamily N-acetyltransferase
MAPGDWTRLAALDPKLARPSPTWSGHLVEVRTGGRYETAAVLCLQTRGPSVIEIVSLVVAPRFRRRGFGSRLLAAVRDTAASDRMRVLAVVPDDDIGTHKFFARNQFRAVEVCRGHFKDRDGYVFEFLPTLGEQIRSAHGRPVRP